MSHINRAQQAFFLDTGTFSNSIDALPMGITTHGEFYNYQTGVLPTQLPAAVTLAIPAKKGLKGYIGIVSLTSEKKAAGSTTSAIICETEAKISSEFHMPLLFPTASMECPAGFVKQ